jgi:hypothetical protein
MAGVIVETLVTGSDNGTGPDRQAQLFSQDTFLAQEAEAANKRYRSGFLPLGIINVLPQVRKTFDNIDGLSESLAGEGQINPPLVVRWSVEGVDEYLGIINLAWKTQITKDQLKPTVEEDGEEHYYVLVAGERRYRAASRLVDHPCLDCQHRIESAPKDERVQTCFDTHFPNGLETRIGDNLPAEEALRIQSAENMHERPPVHEEAAWLERYYRVQ